VCLTTSLRYLDLFSPNLISVIAWVRKLAAAPAPTRLRVAAVIFAILAGWRRRPGAAGGSGCVALMARALA
jgi:hypothetical protein